MVSETYRNGCAENELHATDWIDHISKMKATPKTELRKAENLGRSPDRADALALAVWEVPALEATDEEP